MSSAFEQLLQNIVADATDNGGQAKTASAQGTELDVDAFTAGLSKTAEALRKAAESLPTSTQLAAEQMSMLKDPKKIDKADLHRQHRSFVSQVLSGAKDSKKVPASVGEIQKSASNGSQLLSILRR